MPILCLTVSVLIWCLLVLVLYLLPKRNGYFQVSALVTDPEGMSVVRSAFQLWLELLTPACRADKTLEDRGYTDLGGSGSGRQCRCRVPCNKPPLGVGIDANMADTSFLPWLAWLSYRHKCWSGGITQFQFIFLAGHTFDTTWSDNSQGWMFLRSKTPTVQSSLVDPRTTPGDILFSVRVRKYTTTGGPPDSCLQKSTVTLILIWSCSQMNSSRALV